MDPSHEPPLTMARHIDAVCDAFEAQWRTAQRPRIEDFLAGATEVERPHLLRELLLVEFEHRRQRGEQPQRLEYQQRLPADAEVVRQTIVQFLRPTPAQPSVELLTAKPVESRPVQATAGAVRPALPPADDSHGPPITVTCAAGHVSRIKRKYAGRRGKCPQCDLTIDVPQVSIQETVAQSEPEVAVTVDFRPDPQSHVAPLAKPPLPKGAKQFGRFELLAEVGSGAFGAVYRARDTQLNRDVALKIPRAGIIGVAYEAERFFREARAAAQLRHPHIVPVFDAGQVDEHFYIASGFVAGQTMRQFLRQRRTLPPEEAARLMAAVASALHYAHNKGIIHRDIKPENIMLDQNGEPQVMDFGLARFDEGDSLRTIEGLRMGTPAYMSPEQAGGRSHQADARSDLWSVGVTLYELLSGERPFEGDTAEETMQQVQDCEPLPLRSLDPAIPKDLETICRKCLEKDPQRRYASCQHLAEDLESWLRGEPIRARRVGMTERLWLWARRKPLPAALSAAVGGLLLLLVVLAATTAAIQAHSRADLQVALDQAQDNESKYKQEAQQRAEAAQQAAENAQTAQTRAAEALAAQEKAETAQHQAEGALKAQQEAERQREEARMAASKSAEALTTVSGELDAEKAKRLEAIKARDEALLRADAAKQRDRALEISARRILYANTIGEARKQWEAGNVKDADKLLDDCPEEFRGWEWGYMKHATQVGLCKAFALEKAILTGIAVATTPMRAISRLSGLHLEINPERHFLFHPSGDKVVLLSDNQATVWDCRSGQRVGQFPEPGATVDEPHFSPDGTQFAAVCTVRDPQSGDGVTTLRFYDFRTLCKMAETPLATWTFVPQSRQFNAQTGIDGPDWYYTGDGSRVIGITRMLPETSSSKVGITSVDARTGRVLRVIATTSKDIRSFQTPIPEKFPCPGGLVSWECLPLNAVCEERLLPGLVTQRGSLDGPCLVFRSPESPDSPVCIRVGRTGFGSQGIPNRGSLNFVGANLLFAYVTQVEKNNTVTATGIFAAGAMQKAALPSRLRLIRSYMFLAQGVSRLTFPGFTFPGNIGWSAPPQAGHYPPTVDYELSPCGQWIVNMACLPPEQKYTNVALFSAYSGIRLPFVPNESELVRFAWDKAGDRLATVNRNGLIQLWRPRLPPPGPSIFRPLTREIKSLTFAADSKGVYAAEQAPAKAVAIDVEGIPLAEEPDRLDAKDIVVAFAPQGRLLAAVPERGAAKLRGWGGNATSASFGQGRVTCPCFSADGKLLVFACNNKIGLMDTAEKTERSFGEDIHNVVALAISPDGSKLAAAGSDGVLRIFEVASGKSLLNVRAHGGGAQAIDFSPGGKWLASCGKDARVKLWDTDTGKEVLSLKEPDGPVSLVRFTPDSERLVTAVGQQIKLWDPSTERLVVTLTGHQAPVTALAVSPDGRWLASGDAQGTLILWQSLPAKELAVP